VNFVSLLSFKLNQITKVYKYIPPLPSPPYFPPTRCYVNPNFYYLIVMDDVETRAMD